METGDLKKTQKHWILEGIDRVTRLENKVHEEKHRLNRITYYDLLEFEMKDTKEETPNVVLHIPVSRILATRRGWQLIFQRAVTGRIRDEKFFYNDGKPSFFKNRPDYEYDMDEPEYEDWVENHSEYLAREGIKNEIKDTIIEGLNTRLNPSITMFYPHDSLLRFYPDIPREPHGIEANGTVYEVVRLEYIESKYLKYPVEGYSKPIRPGQYVYHGEDF